MFSNIKTEEIDNNHKNYHLKPQFNMQLITWRPTVTLSLAQKETGRPMVLKRVGVTGLDYEPDTFAKYLIEL